jgi:hypothetical protein
MRERQEFPLWPKSSLNAFGPGAVTFNVNAAVRCQFRGPTSEVQRIRSWRVLAHLFSGHHASSCLEIAVSVSRIQSSPACSGLRLSLRARCFENMVAKITLVSEDGAFTRSAVSPGLYDLIAQGLPNEFT